MEVVKPPARDDYQRKIQTYTGDVTKTAGHLKWPEAKVHAAIAYTKAYPDEIEEALKDQPSYDKLSRLLPGIGRFENYSSALAILG